MSVDGGAALRLAETEAPTTQMAWGEGDVIIVSGLRSGLIRIPPTPGMPTPLTQLADTEAIHASPEVLPGGKTVLFIAGGPTDVTTIEAVPADGGTRKVIVSNGLSPRFIPTGHLLYLLKDTLFAVRFDPDTLQTSGDPVPIVDDVKTTYSGLVAVGGFSVATNGTLVYRRATGPPESGIAGTAQAATVIEWVAGEKRTPLVSAAGVYFDLRFSPDGAQVAMTTLGSAGPDVTVFDPRRDTAPRKISFDSVSVDPVWIGKDGRYVVSLNLGSVMRSTTLRGRVPGGLNWRRIDGGNPQPVLPDVRVVATGSFGPAAGRLAYVVVPPGRDGGLTRRNIFTVSVTEEADQLKFGQPERFSPEQFGEYDPQYSPDGRWIAFVSDRSGGREEVYVRAAAAAGSGVRYERQISAEGGNSPKWSPNRAELLYQSGQQIIAVPYTVRGETLEPEKPAVRIRDLGSTRWALAPDGRIAAITPVTKPADAKAPPPEHTIVLLQNFFDEVRRRVK
jgi:serine/threonine-protein kinase